MRWLGYLDSNQGMTGSKPVALPLGDIPTEARIIGGFIQSVNPPKVRLIAISSVRYKKQQNAIFSMLL